MIISEIQSKRASSYRLAVGLSFMILHFISYFHECTAFFGTGAKMVTFDLIHIGNRKIFLKYHSIPQLILLHVRVISYFT